MDYEFNTGVIFPGYSLELVSDKLVKQINSKHGGRLCTEKEIVVVERTIDGPFTFRFSKDKSHYWKC